MALKRGKEHSISTQEQPAKEQNEIEQRKICHQKRKETEDMRWKAKGEMSGSPIRVEKGVHKEMGFRGKGRMLRQQGEQDHVVIWNPPQQQHRASNATDAGWIWGTTYTPTCHPLAYSSTLKTPLTIGHCAPPFSPQITPHMCCKAHTPTRHVPIRTPLTNILTSLLISNCQKNV